MNTEKLREKIRFNTELLKLVGGGLIAIATGKLGLLLLGDTTIKTFLL